MNWSSSEDLFNGLINFNKMFLNNKEHIKKYHKARKIHSEVLNNMMEYIDSGKLPVEEYFSLIKDDLIRETNNLEFTLDNTTREGANIFNELFIYKNHSKISSLTEIYLEKNKFKNQDKINMLNSMNDSIVSLFKVVKYDFIDGYVTYEDVFTKNRYKVIDISMSSLKELYKDVEVYIYNRIITYDGISFGTGIPISFNGKKNKKLRDFIKSHDYKNCSDFSRCLILYDMSKKYGGHSMRINYNYK